MLSLIERNESGHIVKAGIMHADWFMQSSIEVGEIVLLSNHVIRQFVYRSHRGSYRPIQLHRDQLRLK